MLEREIFLLLTPFVRPHSVIEDDLHRSLFSIDDHFGLFLSHLVFHCWIDYRVTIGNTERHCIVCYYQYFHQCHDNYYSALGSFIFHTRFQNITTVWITNEALDIIEWNRFQSKSLMMYLEGQLLVINLLQNQQHC